jgi:hypothetical protein
MAPKSGLPAGVSVGDPDPPAEGVGEPLVAPPVQAATRTTSAMVVSVRNIFSMAGGRSDS